MNVWLASITDEDLRIVEKEVTDNVAEWDGVDDDLYKVWKTLLELIWMEKKRRSL